MSFSPIRSLAAALLISLPVLSSCGHIDTSACPPLKDYSKAEQAQACAELKAMCPALPPEAGCDRVRQTCPALMLPVLVDDYGTLRKAVRACQPGS